MVSRCLLEISFPSMSLRCLVTPDLTYQFKGATSARPNETVLLPISTRINHVARWRFAKDQTTRGLCSEPSTLSKVCKTPVALNQLACCTSSPAQHLASRTDPISRSQDFKDPLSCKLSQPRRLDFHPGLGQNKYLANRRRNVCRRYLGH